MRRTRGKTAVVFDQQPLWLEAMCRLVKSAGMRVVGNTSDSSRAVELVDRAVPDVFIVGLDAADDATLSCVRLALHRHADLKTIVFGERRDPEGIDEAFAAGASVYCVKTAEKEDLVSALRQTFEQSIFLATDGRHGALSVEALDLTPREVEVLRLVADGRSNLELAETLSVTEKTVKFHLSNVYRKLQVANRTEASRWAQLHGVLD